MKDGDYKLIITKQQLIGNKTKNPTPVSIYFSDFYEVKYVLFFMS